MKVDSEFRLSRIQAEGWNAARRIPVSQLGELDVKVVEELNPYSTPDQRIRWSAGFNNALKSWRR